MLLLDLTASTEKIIYSREEKCTAGAMIVDAVQYYNYHKQQRTSKIVETHHYFFLCVVGIIAILGVRLNEFSFWLLVSASAYHDKAVGWSFVVLSMNLNNIFNHAANRFYEGVARSLIQLAIWCFSAIDTLALLHTAIDGCFKHFRHGKNK